MFKKALVTLTAFIGISAVIYMYTNSNMLTTLNAQSAPVFQLPKGAKVVLGKYNNKEIVWDIGNNTSEYVLMSSKPIVTMATHNSSIPITTTPQTAANRENYCLRFISNDSSIITYCPVTPLINEINNIVLNTNELGITRRNPFMPTVAEAYNGGTLGLTINDRAFKTGVAYVLKGYGLMPEFSNNYYNNYYFTLRQLALDQNMNVAEGRMKDLELGTFISLDNKIGGSSATGWETLGNHSNQFSARAFAIIDKTKVMFAADTSYTDGSWHQYNIDTSNLNVNNELNSNKLRVQSSLTVSLQDIKIKNKSIQKVTKDGRVDLSINANTGVNSKISIILYDETGVDIKYYKMLDDTKNGTNDYPLFLTGVPLGKYKLAIINEEYDDSSQLPVESSMISDLLPLEIVEPHKLTYTKQPQSGATSGKEYEFSKNVNAGQTVGKITVNPQGVMPLTYTVESNGDNSYQNFEIDGLDASNSSSSISLDVKIKSGAPDLVNGGLKAGTYKFCVNAVDANGDPVTATADSKVCTSFNVEKTNLTISFDDTNTTKKSIGEATAGFNETATVNPATGTKIRYHVVGGDTYLIDIDEDTGRITYKGSGAFGKVTIRATADDDPSTGNDNYDSIDTEKEIIIYQEVDGNVTPDSNSSNNTIPTFTASDANIKVNGTIGTIHGTLGTPDTIGGTTTTYRYGLKPGVGDANFFSVDPNTGVIKTTANLGVNSYHITVTVSDNWSTKEIPVTINVGVAAAEDLKFYENSTSNTVITTKSAKATDTGIVVYATVKVTLRHSINSIINHSFYAK